MYLVFFLLIAYVVDSATYPLYTLSQTDKDNIVKYHNFVRTNWAVTQKLTWSDKLATNAGNWAQNCKWEHSAQSFRKYGEDEFGNALVWGENMAKIGTQDLTAKFPFGTLASQVDGWKSEEKDWDCNKEEYYVFADGSSEDGCRKTPNPDGSLPMCGHFTQVVWATTKEVGCALVDCPKDTAWAGYRSQFLVCQYNPGGNEAGAHPLVGSSTLAPDASKVSSKYSKCPSTGYYQTAAVQPLTAENTGVASQDSTHQSQSVSDGITVPVGAFVAVAVVCGIVVFLVILVVIAFIFLVANKNTDIKSAPLL